MLSDYNKKHKSTKLVTKYKNLNHKEYTNKYIYNGNNENYYSKPIILPNEDVSFSFINKLAFLGYEYQSRSDYELKQ